ncbi:MAG TPA: hypothetical protein PK090_04115 [Smithellaceae bacterium]|nr:hypothetical protein [Smithellaceae bacterium]
MLKVITDEKQIGQCARRFTAAFKACADEKISVKLGHQGASVPARVWWSKRLGLWFFSRSVKGVRFENAFGLARPEAKSQLPIAAEINFPAAGIDRRTGGAFARDALGQIYAVHRGIIGGGRKGVGKALFEKHYRGVWSFMEDKDGLSRVAVIGLLSSVRFARQVSVFVRKVERLKAAAESSSQTRFDFPQAGFRPELSGDEPEDLSDALARLCDRDLVTQQLAAWLIRGKSAIGNTAGNDLTILNAEGDGESHVFAVVTDIHKQAVMAAAADLLIRQAATPGSPVAVLVLPEQAALLYENRLQSIHVRILSYRLDGEKVIFPDSAKIRLDQNTQL